MCQQLCIGILHLLHQFRQLADVLVRFRHGKDLSDLRDGGKRIILCLEIFFFGVCQFNLRPGTVKNTLLHSEESVYVGNILGKVQEIILHFHCLFQQCDAVVFLCKQLVTEGCTVFHHVFSGICRESVFLFEPFPKLCPLCVKLVCDIANQTVLIVWNRTQCTVMIIAQKFPALFNQCRGWCNLECNDRLVDFCFFPQVLCDLFFTRRYDSTAVFQYQFL